MKGRKATSNHCQWHLISHFHSSANNGFFFVQIQFSVTYVLSCFSRVWLFVTLMDYRPPGASVHGILQARILERVAMPSSGDLPHPGIKPRVSCVSCVDWESGSLPLAPPGKSRVLHKSRGPNSSAAGHWRDALASPVCRESVWVSHTYSGSVCDKDQGSNSLALFFLQFSHSVVSDSLPPHGLQHTRLPCPSPTPGACSNSCPLSQWCHPTISSSVVPFSSCLQSFPASGSFPMRQFFAWAGQSIGASGSASDLPMIIQDWFQWLVAKV